MRVELTEIQLKALRRLGDRDKSIHQQMDSLYQQMDNANRIKAQVEEDIDLLLAVIFEPHGITEWPEDLKFENGEIIIEEDNGD